MEFERERREARRLLEGIEYGTMTALESWNLIERADPTLVYFIITWLRARYEHDPASEAVLGRVATVLRSYPRIVGIMKTGEAEPLVEWFEDAYQYRDFSSEDFIRVIVDKLEG